jgi:hypothetical protein
MSPLTLGSNPTVNPAQAAPLGDYDRLPSEGASRLSTGVGVLALSEKRRCYGGIAQLTSTDTIIVGRIIRLLEVSGWTGQYVRQRIPSPPVHEPRIELCRRERLGRAGR